jgi:hypothetical protein
VNPLFVNPLTGDYHLRSTVGSYHNGLWLADSLQSPCIDRGDPDSPYNNEPQPNGYRVNMGFEGNTVEASKSVVASMSGAVHGAWNGGLTYNISGDIWVPEDSTLIIQAGAQIIFQGHYKFEVRQNAKLKALGSDSLNILFMPSNHATGWYGLRFLNASDSSRLQYCHLTHGYANGASGRENRCGGAIYLDNSSPTIINCLIDSCQADSGGAIFSANGSHSLISFNTIKENTATSAGAGLYCYNSSPTITHNVIARNVSSVKGGGICCTNTAHPTIQLNQINDNRALDGNGGGLFFTGYTPADTLNKNTFYGNIAGNQGGGLYLSEATLRVVNNIFWNNSALTGSHLYLGPSGTATVNYNDVQGGWTGGTGNISQYPLFVDSLLRNFHLQLASPCVNVGDPNPIYNDPDGSRADIGCYYLLHGIVVSIVPVSTPVLIPQTGGSFTFNIYIHNTSSSNQTFQGWIMQYTPAGVWQGPMLGPVTLGCPAGVTVNRQRNQNVPSTAAPGVYTYTGYVGVYSTVKWDSSSFTYTKLTTGDGPIISDWNNCGEEFNSGLNTLAVIPPTEFSLSQNYPNPFNPQTSINFALPQAAMVSLKVYNLRGELVADLVNGWRMAGYHQVIWQATNLASGLYFYRIETGSHTVVKKMMLMK